jgi:hypothetical protein
MNVVDKVTNEHQSMEKVDVFQSLKAQQIEVNVRHE